MRDMIELGSWVLGAMDLLAKAGGLLFVTFLVGNFVTYWNAVKRGEAPPP